MRNKSSIFLFFLFVACHASAADFVIADGRTCASIYYDPGQPSLDSITAHLLADDILRVTGCRPAVITDISKATGRLIITGSIRSKVITQLLGAHDALYRALSGQWECYGRKLITMPGAAPALVLTGSDPRGAAYGVFSLSEEIGVSPWYWWADVQPEKKKRLVVRADEFVSAPPSVKYRGIFINDEDWGLQPWAAKTFEPSTGDIGPATYAKVFELLLRLKANLLWPAMHPSTKPFYHYPGNQKVAEDYQVIIGSSHAEPMLRNNVGEWNSREMGAFNYRSNKNRVFRYWEERVKESRRFNAIYTMGMRGVHDSGMEGVKGPDEAIPLLDSIIRDQRGLLAKYLPAHVPQVFTIYKEVLDIYNKGLQLPDDITLVWPDDNYGYIQRLNNGKEKSRSGGSGVYYHASYWGRPHDYLWLSSTHPALIREEMMKAWESGSDRLWVLNVGDIKPLEYNIQLFLDMAYNAKPFTRSAYVRTHMQQWLSGMFGKEHGSTLTGLLWEYYQLAFERRPEFMGWSQTEPTTPVALTAYNHFAYGDEAVKRIERYERLHKQVKDIRKMIAAKDTAAFYELIYYPVACASFINKKFLYRDKSCHYARQGRLSAEDYAALSRAAYDAIVRETDFYNNRLMNGKWKHIMSMRPRDLPVFDQPDLIKKEEWAASAKKLAAPGSNTGRQMWDISPEEGGVPMTLPDFHAGRNEAYFIDVFLRGDTTVQWTARTSEKWLRISPASGTLSPTGKKEIRLTVTANTNQHKKGRIIISDGKQSFTVFSNALPAAKTTGAVEENGYVSIFAQSFSRRKDQPGERWQLMRNMGHTGNALAAERNGMNTGNALTAEKNSVDTAFIREHAAWVAYDFHTITDTAPEISIITLPTHPLNDSTGMRYAVSIDDKALKMVDFRTFGRSAEWKQNVLSNTAIRRIKGPFLHKGKHTLKIYLVDPGVILDRLLIDMGGLKPSYGIIPETRP
ncbi:glycosyl hydrolase 115 family protein [Chitinophaga cymbidii]|uniref:Gylcosyl hydrolase 115 C-terminal domain-containing protein n=1 Tax=Chitinophaga cymbidii TaxID=1096750 RepID=A0A512RP78_9BACT|nr:glycosyl hydrolase 115 family protein [Chitinophaga cymbidii]GEP97502.1 hypothetical protein CCY01nite_37620 [Chitinophaga cymbidii]